MITVTVAAGVAFRFWKQSTKQLSTAKALPFLAKCKTVCSAKGCYQRWPHPVTHFHSLTSLKILLSTVLQQKLITHQIIHIHLCSALFISFYFLSALTFSFYSVFSLFLPQSIITFCLIHFYSSFAINHHITFNVHILI